LIKNINIFDKVNKLNTSDQKAIVDYLTKIDTVFAILIPEKEEDLDKGMMDLINERVQARKDKNWKRADEIRNELLEKDIELEDTSTGTIWKKKV
jgi:cysteinyl-tRNA synthetase